MSLSNPFAPRTPPISAPQTPPPSPAQSKPDAMPGRAVGVRVVRAKDMKAEAIAFYKFGVGNGESTHMEYLNRHWTWMFKEITVITGYPNHGKSWWVLALMLVKSAVKGWKFAIYVPENETDVFVGLAEMLVGMTANPKIAQRMSLRQLEDALDWLHDHFFMVTASEGLTPDELLAEFAAIHEEHGLHGTLTDPWNQLNHVFQAREDLYLSAEFSKWKRFAIKHNLCVLVTAHPAGAVKNKDNKLLCPDAFSISGGKMWNNKFDNVLAVFRPAFPEPQVELHIHKIKKQGRVGKPGNIELSFDVQTQRYECVTSNETHPLTTVSFNAPGTKPDDDNPATWVDSSPHGGLSNSNQFSS